MEAEWCPLWEFPGYWISNTGLVRHIDRQYPVATHINNTGSVYVSLWRDNKAHNRTLPLLVASTFLEAPQFDTFDTPINLDGDRRNNNVSNLAWRPNWFARRYRQQFKNNKRGYKIPVVLLDTGERFPTSWEAAIKYGLIDQDILIATMNGEPVWPLNFTFQPVKRTSYQHV